MRPSRRATKSPCWVAADARTACADHGRHHRAAEDGRGRSRRTVSTSGSSGKRFGRRRGLRDRLVDERPVDSCSGDERSHASRAAACSACFLDRPCPGRLATPPTRRRRRTAWRGRARRRSPRSGGARRTGGRTAPAAGSCSPGRRGRRRPPRSGRRAGASPARRPAPSPRRGRRRRSAPPWRRPGSTASPGRRRSPPPCRAAGRRPGRGSPATSASAAELTTDARTLASSPSGSVRVGAEEVVGDDQAEHGVAQKLQPLVGRGAPASPRTTSGGRAPAAEQVRRRRTPSRAGAASSARAESDGPGQATPPRCGVSRGPPSLATT